MFLFIYGQDTYSSQQKLNEIVGHYKKLHKSGLNLKYFEGEDADLENFQDETQQSTMFKEKKLIVLKNVFLNPLFKEKFLKNSEKFMNSQDIFLFYETNEISKNDRLFKLLKKHGKSQEFKLLEGQKLKNWVKKEFENHGAKADLDIVDELINFVGNDSWQLSNEIKKLVSYRRNKNIRIKDIELLVIPKVEPDIFKTIDAIASKNKKQALTLLKKHLEKGDPPLYLLKMINFQIRNLLLVRSDELKKGFPANYLRTLSNKLKLHPYVVRKTVQQAENFSFTELKKIYQKIFEADLNIKTGKLDPQTALDLLIAEI